MNGANVIVYDSNEKLTNIEVIADRMNYYFCEVGKKLCESITLDKMQYITDLNINSIFLIIRIL